jgi:hypothetical protein
LVQQINNPFYPALGVGITFQVMAVTRQSTSHHNTIDAVFQGMQDHQFIQFA